MRAATTPVPDTRSRSHGEGRGLGELLARRINRLEAANAELRRWLRTAIICGASIAAMCVAIAVWMGMWGWQEARATRAEVVDALEQAQVDWREQARALPTSNRRPAPPARSSVVRASGQTGATNQGDEVVHGPSETHSPIVASIREPIMIDDLRVELRRARLSKDEITTFFGVPTFSPTPLLQLTVALENASESATIDLSFLKSDGSGRSRELILCDNHRTFYRLYDVTPDVEFDDAVLKPGDSTVVVLSFPAPRENAETLMFSLPCESDQGRTISFHIPVAVIEAEE